MISMLLLTLLRFSSSVVRKMKSVLIPSSQSSQLAIDSDSPNSSDNGKPQVSSYESADYESMHQQIPKFHDIEHDTELRG
ncbi:hypothetical protein Nepgr_029306 [Nepenthes gracilis]|uniref:Uncharacterized protein n=1 Tax=Nepenthes gracilis TaxID=150966 RepID=A0AAD3Y357_NEPGR|nr:hypothetical protein Nepgr_029306 [Nepenthes gracilis]